MSASIDSTKKVYLIVHGQRQLIEKLKEKLAVKGFNKENLQLASLSEAGSTGEYVAMVWPPMAPTEIVISEITAKQDDAGATGMGAWSSVGQKELYRMPL